MKTSVVAGLILALGLLLPYSSHAQSRKKVAVLGFDDRTVQIQTYGIGQRVTDQLISALAGNASFEVIDREYLAQVMREQTQGYGNRFDAVGAAHLGKLANANIIIIGQVDAFSANVSSVSKQNLLGNKVEQDGLVNLRVTARVIQVETGAILGAPSVESEQKAVLSQSSDHSSAWAMAGVRVPDMSAQRGTPSGGIQKLVDQAIYDASSQLALKINAMAPSTPVPMILPKFVGMEDGLVVVNKGQTAGIKVGDKFEVTRITQSSLIDPDTHQPIAHKTKQCVLTITVVEDSNASGKCDGSGAPQAGDTFTSVPRQG